MTVVHEGLPGSSQTTYLADGMISVYGPNNWSLVITQSSLVDLEIRQLTPGETDDFARLTGAGEESRWVSPSLDHQHT
jgi:hypothetical protein